ncbi:hypothetical protein ABW20_dc0107309 [Dactylellina cionopaga]|nr:hypothetical protein ABW20_dc0107309 [Dactylellina cionopaga]
MLAKSIFIVSLLLASASAKPPKPSPTTVATITAAPTVAAAAGVPCVGGDLKTTYCATRSGCFPYAGQTVSGRCIYTGHE